MSHVRIGLVLVQYKRQCYLMSILVIFQQRSLTRNLERPKTVRFLIPKMSALQCDVKALAKKMFEREGGPVAEVRDVHEESTLHEFYKIAYVG